MEKLVIISLLLLIVSYGFGQSVSVVFTPNKSGPYWYGETVAFNYEYKIGSNPVPLPSLCQESFQISGNTGGTAAKVTGAQTVNATWGAQKSTTAKVNINLTQCNVVSYRKNYPSGSYSVMSITEETPSAIATATTHIPVCQSAPIQFSVDGMGHPQWGQQSRYGL